MDKYVFMNEKPENRYQNLANAIVIKAVDDYKLALEFNITRLQKECEKFFRSEWFTFLCDLDPEHIIRTLQEETRKSCKSH